VTPAESRPHGGSEVLEDAHLPVIDVGGLFSDDSAVRAAVARQMRLACENTGFFYVANHGIDPALIARTFAESKRFFDQPQALKDQVHIRNTDIFRGYDGPGTEALNLVTGKDNKESMYMGVHLDDDHPLVRAGTPHHGPNQWPPGLPGWREAIEAYFDAMSGLSRQLLRGLALSLDMPWDFFDPALVDAQYAVRLLHYPPHPGANPNNALGAGEHTDFGAMTILAQDDTGGLELRLRTGQWVAARPIPGAFVINLGDLIARWTNDVYTSTLHRVMNRSAHDRYSIAFFNSTAFHTPIECIPTCRSADRPPRYAPTTAGAHLDEMKKRSYGSGARGKPLS
jgi:isopenicillin N synthase-like dioxygenase